eukprot:9064711-Alexandrium_andersonii.AAC.1
MCIRDSLSSRSSALVLLEALRLVAARASPAHCCARLRPFKRLPGPCTQLCGPPPLWPLVGLSEEAGPPWLRPGQF